MNRILPRRGAVLLVVLSTVLAGVVVPTGAGVASAEGQPWTVPAMQEWTSGGPGFVPTPLTAVVVDRTDADELTDEAKVFAEDLSALLGRTVPVTTGPALPGQLELRLDPDVELGDEGYELSVRPVLRVSAANQLGVWNGTRSVLQMLSQSRRLPGGTAEDRPDYSYRGVSFCNCVTYWSVEYLKRLIRQMSYLKLNALHVEMMLELDGFPEFDTWSRPRYTPEQVRELAAFAKRYRVRLIPQVNFPGHAEYQLQGHPELVLSNDDGTVPNNVDMGNPAGYRHMRTVIEATADVFGGREFHAGGDEYLGTAAAFEEYPSLVERARQEVGPDAAAAEVMPLHFNWTWNEVLEPADRTMYMWNDQLFEGLRTELDPDIVVEHWIDFEGRLRPKQIASNGNQLVNAHVNLYMLGSGLNSGNDWVYDEFEVNEFHGGDVLDADDPSLLGAELAVWPPREKSTEFDLEPALNDRMFPFATKVWGGPRLAPTYQKFQDIATAVGHAPGYRTPTPVEFGTYTLRNNATGRLLAPARSDGRFASLVQATAEGDSDQAWLIDSDQQGRYTLRNLATGLCASVASTDAAGTDALLGDCADPRASFYLQPDQDAARVRSMPSGQLLTPVNGSDGANVRQEPSGSDRPQLWTLEPADPTVAVVADQVIVDTVPGAERTLEYEVTNTGERAVVDVNASLRTPDGVRAEPLTPTSFRYLGPGESRRLAWRVGLPAAVPNDAPVVVSLDYRQDGERRQAGATVWLEPANLSEGKPAEQSTTDWGGTADKAVDGDVDGVFGNGSVTHTADGWEDQPWWQVDLGAVYPIDQIRIWNRTDCCPERLSDYYVIVADQPITGDTVEESLLTPGAWYVHETAVAGSPTVVSAGDDLTGRYLRIHLDAKRPLSLAEVQVYPPATR